MATETQTPGSAETGRLPRAKYLVAAYPTTVLLLLFGVPIVLLFVFSFFQNVSGGYLRYVLTPENYLRFFAGGLYVDRLLFTLQIAAVTTVVSLVMGYPLAYRLARMRSTVARQAILTVVVSSLWLTFIIRGYAWSVLLDSNGLIPGIASAVGLLEQPVSFVPSYWALVVSMVYVFLPFMILTLYTSIKNVEGSLLEASRNLGAGPVGTFRHVTFPLTKSGIVSGSLLVFVLSLGVYVLPRLLGSPSDWTLAVLIGNQVTIESNIPFGAALSIILMVLVVALIVVAVRVADIDAFGVGGEEA